ncbi:UDP-N-acetylglucosamine 2-epimerase [Halobium salinum]|uniref:UDP-N-acetylglucosamine 2-epimerase n=1 Tax=Halobium salinum TaxID=1364940 RepID=A0ABD5PA72_9EURY|nr:UDP-N-acetylglucosamine 2-epimerase [Halobium salinum]
MSGSERTRRIAVVTGTRAEYGLLKPGMDALRDANDIELQVVVTGMHLSPAHGTTVNDLVADGFEVDREVYMQLAGDTGRSMAKSLGVGTSGMAEALGDLDPDLVLVLGDRDEALAAGLAAVHMNVPVAHVHGGDSMGGAIIDDSIRHALTKFAHLHFPASERSHERILKLGEEPWRVTTVGAPGLDAVLAGEFSDPSEVRASLNLDPVRPLALVVQHPVTTRPDEAGAQMRETLAAVDSFDVRPVVVHPNSDAGSERIVAVIEERRAFDESEGLVAFRSLPRRDYLGLMAAAEVMVGNSSSAIIEAPSLDLPVVDVGPRQAGRERADHTLSVPHDREAIESALERCLHDAPHRETVAAASNPYDYGGAGNRIAERLRTVELGERLLRKRLTF